ncbi:D-lactate dehydrogenase [Allosphingosinicella deserti]|uniref:Quinone-dependent D-lactate dehydrogenase n=1 Tax=Allosphingosinicella deserti TaxID=2116704 RepID=A0A2P7QM74_9SPHN|nr:D-lactate dehydrogenase [Sphingomonas deserti]PSJ39060.1 D-lactate dehydrogenase [Sphingomonas deserti]
MDNALPARSASTEIPSSDLVSRLRAIVGRRHVLTGVSATRPYATGYRVGGGPVAAVVRPRSLVELWRALCACVAADHIVIAQAANTGLTGGSTPDGAYDRPVVILSTRRIVAAWLLRDGRQVVALAGTTLDGLERMLAPLEREPHSVIGSSCIGASVVGGICNTSGGALIRRGPAYTEYALYAQVDADGEVQLCNRLGLHLGAAPEAILGRLDRGEVSDADIESDDRAASAADYEAQVRAVDAPSAARFNADPGRLFEASGSAGRVIVFAVRLDTFPRDARTATFYVGSNDPGDLTTLRRRMLAEGRTLPVSAEYIDREAFDVAARYGKDVFLAVRRLGTQRLGTLFAWKARIDRFARWTRILPANLSDHLAQAASRLAPAHLPPRLTAWRDRYAHHLILKVAGEGIEETRTLLGAIFPSASGDVFECTAEEASAAFLHRFAVAGAAIRYRAIHQREVGALIALDVALRRNDEDWHAPLPADVAAPIVRTLRYGHFFCHVFHLDYLVETGADAAALERRMLALLDARGAEYPAEHNVGHHYPAKPALAAHYRALDPGNRLNPGIGGTSRALGWGMAGRGE